MPTKPKRPTRLIKPITAGKPKKDGADEKSDKPIKPTRIDQAGLSQRFVPIPVAERNYDGLVVGSDGALFYIARRQPGSSTEPPGPNREADADLYRFNFEDREEKLLKSHLVDFSASADRKKLLLKLAEGKLEVADADREARPEIRRSERCEDARRPAPGMAADL